MILLLAACEPAACDSFTWYLDRDGDGFGDPSSAFEACDPGEGIPDGTDCDDNAAGIHPGAEDVPYNGADEDCAGDPDDDLDQDGYGTAEDCDDADPAIHPGAEEDCGDPTDQDCDGTPNGERMVGCSAHYEDGDGDGYGAVERCACEAEPGLVDSSGDCDDANPAVHPTAPERCDGVPNDCAAGDESGLAALEGADGWSDATALLQGDPTAAALLELDGATLHLCAGTWYARFEVPATTAAIVGHGGPVLDGAPGRVLVDATDATLSLSGLTLRAAGNEGAIRVADTALTLDDVVVEDTLAGGAVTLEGGTLVVRASTFRHNVGGVAGAITATGALSIAGSVFEENVGAAAGGIWLQNDGDAEIVDTELRANLAEAGSGGALHVVQDGGAVHLEALTVEANHAGGAGDATGGGIHAEIHGGAFTLADSSLQGNVASGAGTNAGGGLYLAVGAEATAEVTGTRFESNAADAGAGSLGGGLAATVAGALHLQACELRDNAAVDGDGALLASDSAASLVVEGSEVANNGGYGILWYPSGEPHRLELRDSRVTGHRYYGVLLGGTGTGHEVSCEGSKAGEAGVYGNPGYGIAASCGSFGTPCTVRADTCDFGTEGTATDNGVDLLLDGVEYTYEDDATFVLP